MESAEIFFIRTGRELWCENIQSGMDGGLHAEL